MSAGTGRGHSGCWRGTCSTTFRVQRVEAGTDVDNVAEQRALEKAGFTREGVLRGHSFRLGAWQDTMLYTVLRGELPAD